MVAAEHDRSPLAVASTSLPETAFPDFEGSPWLAYGRGGEIAGDPETPEQFAAAYTCLLHLTACVAQPNAEATPDDVMAEFVWYTAWVERYNETSREIGEGELEATFTLAHVRALSERRLAALEEYGGEYRDERGVFEKVHDWLTQATITRSG
jgi:hypothetical protein